jgi:Protein of unknown function (DUF3501)
MAGLSEGEVRTGARYEAERSAGRARLASTAGLRRLDLDDGLALVFETRETVRTALEELLRAERTADPAGISAEAAAFSELLGGESDLVATLYLDVADPVALAERLAELPGIAAAVSLGIGDDRVPATPEMADGVSGAFALRFPLEVAQRSALLDGAAMTVAVDHPRCRARVSLGVEQVRAIAVDLRR